MKWHDEVVAATEIDLLSEIYITLNIRHTESVHCTLVHTFYCMDVARMQAEPKNYCDR